MIIDGAMMDVLHDKFGLKFLDKDQNVYNDVLVYKSAVIASPKTRTKESIAVHWFDGTWASHKKSFASMVKNFLKAHCFVVFNYLRRICR